MNSGYPQLVCIADRRLTSSIVPALAKAAVRGHSRGWPPGAARCNRGARLWHPSVPLEPGRQLQPGRTQMNERRAAGCHSAHSAAIAADCKVASCPRQAANCNQGRAGGMRCPGLAAARTAQPRPPHTARSRPAGSRSSMLQLADKQRAWRLTAEIRRRNCISGRRLAASWTMCLRMACNAMSPFVSIVAQTASAVYAYRPVRRAAGIAQPSTNYPISPGGNMETPRKAWGRR
jgi:hypothetical protein